MKGETRQSQIAGIRICVTSGGTRPLYPCVSQGMPLEMFPGEVAPTGASREQCSGERCNCEPTGNLEPCLLSEVNSSLETQGEFYGLHNLECYHIPCQIDFCDFIDYK